MYKAGFHPAAEFWQRLSVECGCASVCSTTEGRWHSLPQPLTPLALRFATLWLGPWIVNSRLSLQRHSFERDKQEKMGSQHLGEQPEVGKALYGHYQTGCWGVMRLAELVPGCPQFLPGKVLPCSDHPPPSLKGTGKGWSKGCKSHALGCLHILLTLAFSSPAHLQSLPAGVSWGRPWKGRWSCCIYSQHYTFKQGPVLKGPQNKAERLGTLLPWRLLAAGRQLPHPCRTHKSCCSTCTPLAKMYNHPSADDASRWTSQPCATRKPRTTWEKLYLKQNSLIVCTIKTQISAWLQHE